MAVETPASFNGGTPNLGWGLIIMEHFCAGLSLTALDTSSHLVLVPALKLYVIILIK